MSSFNFRLLTLAREIRGCTQSDLAKNTNTDQGIISKIEKGLIVPSEELIEKYSLYLNFPNEFFFQEGSKTPISDFFYRKRVTMPVKEKNRIEAEIELIRLVYTKLLKSVEIPDPKFPNFSINGNFTSEDAAIQTREFYKMPKGAVKNLISILEKSGITVLYIDTQNTKFDGMTVYTDTNYPIIILNKNMPNDRKKFTIAHELGHQIMHLPFRYDFEMYERVSQNPDALEKEADKFAAEFLMPKRECKVELQNLKYGELEQLKLYWQISKKAIIYRARALDAITPERYKSLLIELSRTGERVKESFDVFLEEPKIMKQIFNAYRTQLNYTNNELSEVLSISEKDLIKISNDNSGSKLRIAI